MNELDRTFTLQIEVSISGADYGDAVKEIERRLTTDDTNDTHRHPAKDPRQLVIAEIKTKRTRGV
jgi:hypothetical protein